MFTTKKVLGGCILLPILLVTSCYAKMYVDRRMYNLPGEVLKSSVIPTRSLDSAMQVAEVLDQYVQPRFEILRDKNFGAMRIVYRKHAGIVQLKVESEQEQKLIADVNAAHRDYAISLLRSTPTPGSEDFQVTPRLHLLYFNRQAVATDWDHYERWPAGEIATKNHFDLDALQQKAIANLPQLMAGRECRMEQGAWAVLMRPVYASKQACLSCHTAARPGSTLGIMVYAVHKSRRNDVTEVGLR